jgi:xanthine dehydrogenase accessory factor
VSHSLHRLLPLFDRLRAEGSAMVWAVVLNTAGPTYSKAGAHMLIAPDGQYAGLLSGGCLEGDLAEHARRAMARGEAMRVSYDMRTPDDRLFGLGSGCEGAMEILLVPLSAQRDWEPLSRLASSWRAERREALWLVVNSTDPQLPPGTGHFPGDADPRPRLPSREFAPSTPTDGPTRLLTSALPGVDLLLLRQDPPPRLLVLGAGPDAQPVVAMAAQLGWSITVVDHRRHYAQAGLFPGASAVLEGGPAAVPSLLDAPIRYAAAVVMSHHLDTDLAYLRALAASPVPYVGLLGPAPRRERLLAELGPARQALAGRLRAPVGLDIGADSPESIALAIIAEIHSVLAGRDVAGPMSRPLT